MLDIYGFWKRNVRGKKENPDVLHLHGKRLFDTAPPDFWQLSIALAIYYQDFLIISSSLEKILFLLGI